MKTPPIYASAENNVKARLFSDLVRDALEEYSYDAGCMFKEDALKATKMVESILKPRGLPKAQWSILRSLVLTNGFNYVFRKTLKDPANVNHCVETWFYVGKKMSETEFEGHKRSLIVRRLDKLRNLDQESARHWNQIKNEYYEFELAQRDAAQI
ncbi:hypothetical protein FPRO04_12241 [Fusarium proliferatum]|nr:hypothetical protein FPRO04_12241 [Fusarium proliferatum]